MFRKIGLIILLNYSFLNNYVYSGMVSIENEFISAENFERQHTNLREK